MLLSSQVVTQFSFPYNGNNFPFQGTHHSLSAIGWACSFLPCTDSSLICFSISTLDSCDYIIEKNTSYLTPIPFIKSIPAVIYSSKPSLWENSTTSLISVISCLSIQTLTYSTPSCVIENKSICTYKTRKCLEDHLKGVESKERQAFSLHEETACLSQLWSCIRIWGNMEETHGIKTCRDTWMRHIGERHVGRLTMAAITLTCIWFCYFVPEYLVLSAPFLWFPVRKCLKHVTNFWVSVVLLWTKHIWMGIYAWRDG